MSVRIGAGVSVELDPLAASVQAAGTAASALDGAPADLALVFASGAHLFAPEFTLEGVHGVMQPRALVGCGAGGVLGGDRELESGTAVAVWAAAFDGAGEVAPFHATVSTDEIDGIPELEGAGGMILLSDPYTFPTDAALAALTRQSPTVPVVGGIASARSADGAGTLLFGEQVCEEGAVGVSLHGIEMLPCVSQGAAPLGREVTITAADGHVIHELAGRPALETLEGIITELSPRERALVSAGVLIGIVIDSGKPEYQQGDFLVRGLLDADPGSGTLAVGAEVREGQVLRLHARDAKSADEDLCRTLRLHIEAMAGASPAGALVFSCNGRGQAMFGSCDHDAKTVQRELGGAPAAGFFAAGEIGPVGGRSFLHGFTATLAVFPG
ncbi:MAG: FIST N-terminal domain-containing protein [Solirubrobacteraceae bacterium]